MVTLPDAGGPDSHPADDAPVVPGRLPLLGHTLPILVRPLRFLSSLRSHGEVVRIYLGPLPVYVVTSPELAWQVLATDGDKFDKGIAFDKFRPLFGDGLITARSDAYRRQRRLVQPAFHRTRIDRYVDTMTHLASELTESWQPGQVVAVDHAMENLALGIVARTLFSTELGHNAIAEVQHSLPILRRYGMVRAFSPTMVERLPIPGNRRFDQATTRLRRVVHDVIAAARADGIDRGDLLSMLLLTRDEETGQGMSDQQVHDEVVSILVAGTETTGTALAWLFHELAAHPQIERRFHAEIDQVLASRPATVEDIPMLTYARRIMHEVLRSYALPILMRRTRVSIDLAGMRIPPGVEIALSPHALHHDARLHPDPSRFDPDRWLPDRAAPLPPGAFIPFGGGTRHCPGFLFAETEIAIVATTIATRWRLVPVTGKPVHTKATSTVRPNRLPMTVVPRHA